MNAVFRPIYAVVAFALVAVALLAQFAAPASAAQLAVAHRGIATFEATACTDQTIDFTTAASSSAQTEIQVSGIPAACQGATGKAVVVDGSGNALSETTWTMSTGTATIPAPAFDTAAVAGVVLVANGWWIDATWAAPVPPVLPPVSCVPIDENGDPTSGSCVPTVTGQSFWDENAGWHHLQLNIKVQSSENRWELTINYADPSWDGGGFTPVFVGSSYNAIAAPGYTCAELPLFTVWKEAGDVAWSNNVSLYATDKPGSTNGSTPICQ